MSLCFCVLGDCLLGRDIKSLQIHTFLVSAHNMSASQFIKRISTFASRLFTTMGFNLCVLGRWSAGKNPKVSPSLTLPDSSVRLYVCLCMFCICAFSNFILSTSTSMCFHYLISMCQSDWGRDQPPLPSIRHKTLNLTSVATKIIGSPETKWTDTTSGIYTTDKSSSLSVTTDFSESLQSPVSRKK